MEQRVARWVLTMSDYAGSREFLMGHQSMAHMLGVRRASITGAAGKLQAAGLIRYRHGRLGVLDKPGLGAKCCECYRFIAQQYESLYAGLPGLLSRSMATVPDG
jgi:hypothetical protein